MPSYPLENAATFGAACRAARRSLGLTLEDAAGAAGVSFRFASELERGKPTCELEKSLKYARMLGLRLLCESPVEISVASPRIRKR